MSIISMTYDKAIEENFKFMGSNAAEWRSIPVKEFVKTKDNKGKIRSMPMFDFPKDYTPAPTLYSSSGNQAVCGLCGHPIAIVYWIQNDSKKWTLPIGSECVTHFEDKSGKEIVKETMWRENMNLLKELVQTRKDIKNLFSQHYHGYYGGFWEVRDPKAVKIYKELLDIRGKLDEESSNAAITRWVNKSGQKVRSLIDQAKKIIVSEVDMIVGIDHITDLKEKLEKLQQPQDASQVRTANRLRVAIRVLTQKNLQ